MVEVSIQHILGTVALIGLVISATLAYQVVVGYVETNILKSQLKQVAEYVSLNIVSLVNLVEFAYGELSTETVTKDLNLPVDLGGKSYLVRIVKEGDAWCVEAALATRADLNAKSPIPLSSTRALVRFITDPSSADGPSDENVAVAAELYGGDPKALIWCENKYGEYLCVGLGRRIA